MIETVKKIVNWVKNLFNDKGKRVEPEHYIDKETGDFWYDGEFTLDGNGEELDEDLNPHTVESWTLEQLLGDE